jgi:hypothetical protein
LKQGNANSQLIFQSCDQNGNPYTNISAKYNELNLNSSVNLNINAPYVYGTTAGTFNYTASAFNLTGAVKIYETTGTATTSTTGTLVLEHGNRGGQSSIVFVSANNRTSDYGYIRYIDDVSSSTTNEKSRLEIGTENDAGPLYASVADALVLQKNGGYVGIGTSNPTSTLDVNGTITATGITISNSLTLNGITIGRGGGNQVYSTAVGASALAVSTGDSNSAFGYYALNANTSGYFNCAFGVGTLAVNTTGFSNTAYGFNALNKNTTGLTNTAVGNNALYYTNGSYNVAVGNSALYWNTTGNENSAVGHDSLYYNATGFSNTSFGSQSLNNLECKISPVNGVTYPLAEGGYRNVAVGQTALYYMVNGILNTAIGNGAGNTCTHEFFKKCTFLGADTGISTTMANKSTSNVRYYENSTAIGYGAVFDGNNQIVLGTSTETVKIPGILNVFKGLSLKTTNASYSTKYAELTVWEGNGDTYFLLKNGSNLTFRCDSDRDGKNYTDNIYLISITNHATDWTQIKAYYNYVEKITFRNVSEDAGPNKIQLYTGYGFGIDSYTLKYLTSAYHKFYTGSSDSANGVLRANISNNGLYMYDIVSPYTNYTRINQEGLNFVFRNWQENGEFFFQNLVGTTLTTRLHITSTTSYFYTAVQASSFSTAGDINLTGTSGAIKLAGDINLTGTSGAIKFNGTSSKIYDNLQLHIYTDDNMYFDVASATPLLLTNTTATFNVNVSTAYNISCARSLTMDTVCQGVYGGFLLSGNTDTRTAAENSYYNLQGLYCSWNQDNGGGRGSFVCNKGGGSGGFDFILNTSSTAGSKFSKIVQIDSGGGITATSYNATSDYRIKEDVKPLDENFTVDKLKPVAYHNTQLNKQDIGFIAHEVQEEYPFMVNGEKDGKDMQTLNYTSIIGILVKEIQDLKSEMKGMRETISSLQSKLES